MVFVYCFCCGKFAVGMRNCCEARVFSIVTSQQFVESAQILDDTCRRWGAELSVPKTKWMYISDSAVARRLPELEISGQIIERVHEFVYLGSLIADTYILGVAENVTRRVAEASIGPKFLEG